MQAHRALSVLRRSAPTVRSISIRRWQSQLQGAHQTYFQAPDVPKPKWRWRILRGTLLSLTCLGIGAVYGASTALTTLDKKLDEVTKASEGLLDQAMSLGHDEQGDAKLPELLAEGMRVVRDTISTGAWDSNVVDARLSEYAGLSIYGDVVSHEASLASNTPIEDFRASGAASFLNEDNEWALWGIFDGHAGPKTSFTVATLLINSVFGKFTKVVFDDNLDLDPTVVEQALKEAFKSVDSMLLSDRPEFRQDSPQYEMHRTMHFYTAADQGSCALLSAYDSANSMLYVANVGDSRAVLGRWNEQQGRYVATALSTDHTGFNQDEVARLNAEHPGEKVIDPKTGRIFGLAVTRAFGDSRWKLPQAEQEYRHKTFFVSPPRPGGVIKTPPYLTAEPEVTATKIHKGDFVIMASDGLWDKLSNDQAVHLVQMWLDKYQPQDLLAKLKTGEDLPTSSPRPIPNTLGEDVYYDEENRVTAWRNNEKHFTVEDTHCGIHLTRNALGGDRLGLLANILATGKQQMRDIKDDITVSVLFFGTDLAPEHRDQQKFVYVRKDQQ